MTDKSNIVLIGMPGAGKSTVGVLLAKALGRYFLDTDIYIQAIENRELQEIIDEKGLEEFCRIEESHIICIDIKNAVIATGGSAVYSVQAMHWLARDGIIIHLDLPYEEIERRVTNLYTRGVVMEKSQTLRGLYEKRQPLYKSYAEITIDCGGKRHEDIVDEIINRIGAKVQRCRGTKRG
ncbi:MAG: shikimate kinase [Phycisphaerae bacterium]|jgi:shikimate kinase